MRAVLLLLIGGLLSVHPAAAQNRLSGPAPSVLFTAGASDRALVVPWAADTSTPTSHPTHWKKGALIGGILGAIGGAFLGHEFCRGSDDTDSNCVGATLGGAAGGAFGLGLIGALIGGAFPKEE